MTAADSRNIAQQSTAVCIYLTVYYHHPLITRTIYTVKPRYLATFRPGHNSGERRGWRLNEGSIKYDRKQ